MPSMRRAWRTEMLSQRRHLRCFAQYLSGFAFRQRSRIFTVVSIVPSTCQAQRSAMPFATPRPEVLCPELVGLSIAVALSRCRGLECRAQYTSCLACSDAFTVLQSNMPMFPSPHVAALFPVCIAYDHQVSAILY